MSQIRKTSSTLGSKGSSFKHTIQFSIQMHTQLVKSMCCRVAAFHVGALTVM